MLVGNVELRVPLLRPFGMSHGVYGPLPVELALFADGGVAWRGGERPEFLGGTRPGITSAGFAIRAATGFVVFEFNVARPFQGADRGWKFGFNMAPGW